MGGHREEKQEVGDWKAGKMLLGAKEEVGENVIGDGGFEVLTIIFCFCSYNNL